MATPALSAARALGEGGLPAAAHSSPPGAPAAEGAAGGHAAGAPPSPEAGGDSCGVSSSHRAGRHERPASTCSEARERSDSAERPGGRSHKRARHPSASANGAGPSAPSASQDTQGAQAEQRQQLRAPFDGHNMLTDTAANGVVRVAWPLLHRACEERLCRVLDLYHARASSSADLCEGPQLPILPEGERFEAMKERLVASLGYFRQAPPFTVQRLCEILLVPTLHYSTLAKLVLALEKCLLVQTSISVDVNAAQPALPPRAFATVPAPAPSQLCQHGSPQHGGEGNASDTDGSDAATAAGSDHSGQ